MSTDDSNTESDAGSYLQRVNVSPLGQGITPDGQPFRGNSVFDRARLGSGDGLREALHQEAFNGKRNLYEALGYETDPEYRHFRARYERSDFAVALVDRPAEKAWAEPTVSDTGNDSDDPSDFEVAAEAFLSGDYTRQDPVEVFQRVTRMERLGEFALLFLGLADDAVADGGIESLSDPVDADSLAPESDDPTAGLEKLKYITPYDEGRIDADEIDLVEDVTDERFGMPETYRVDLGDHAPDADIHHTRIIHVVGQVFDEELKSNSVLEQSLNRLDDIEKIYGASAEAFWRTAYQGFVVKPPTIDGTTAEFAQGKDELSNQIDKYLHNFQREIFVNGDIETLDSDTQDPSGHIDSEVKALAAGHQWPQSVLMGNETGERATQEDRAMVHERVAEYREEFCEAKVLRTTFQRLINHNILPEPLGDMLFEWPTQDEPTEKEVAETERVRSETVRNVGDTVDTAAKVEYVETGEWPERVTEPPGDEAMEPVSNFAVDESNPRVQDQFERSNANQYGEGDPVDTPKGIGVVTEAYSEPVTYDGNTWEASSDSPVYEVVLETTDPNFWFFKASDLSMRDDIVSDVENPEADLKDAEVTSNVYTETGEIRSNCTPCTLRANDIGFDSWPDSWEKSSKPARLIALDAWTSMGGTWTGCFAEIGSKRICSSFKDEMYGTTNWRGGWAD